MNTLISNIDKLILEINKTPNNVICVILGNPKYINKPKIKSLADKFYLTIKQILEQKNYTVMFEPSEDFYKHNTKASYWIGHSRGCSIFGFNNQKYLPHIKRICLQTKAIDGDDPLHYELSKNDLENLNNIPLYNTQNKFKRVSVIIVKDNKICITKNNEFPGGRVENNETNEAAASREALEEVGIKIKNIRYSKFQSDFDSNITTWGIPGTCYWYYAEFDEYDNSLFDKEKDGTTFKWIDYDKSLELAKTSRFGMNNYNALKNIK